MGGTGPAEGGMGQRRGRGGASLEAGKGAVSATLPISFSPSWPQSTFSCPLGLVTAKSLEQVEADPFGQPRLTPLGMGANVSVSRF